MRRVHNTTSNYSINFFQNYNCVVYDNTLKFRNLTNRRLIPEVINSLKRLHIKFKHKEINLDFELVDTIYPFPAIPVLGYIEFFKKEYGVKFNYLNTSNYLKKIHFYEPDVILANFDPNKTNCLDRVWSFKNSEEVHLLVDGIISSLRKSIECEDGVIDACNWGLNEIMDNVIQHSEQNEGFIMAQVHKENKQIGVCIFDYGIGIFKSLLNSEYRPRNSADAISLSVQEGVTRDKKIGQGNGMWGLYNIITQNDGQLLIISGKGALNYINSTQSTESDNDIIMLGPDNQSTIVQFNIKLDKPISIKKALGGYKMVDLFIENLENENDQIEYKIRDQSTGTGTRQSGERIRNELLNIYKKSKKPIIIDFDGISIIASSFADELIGKLVAELGIFKFQAIFKLKNMNETIQSITQRSVSQRLAESLNNKD